jgi:hypothetical protein
VLLSTALLAGAPVGSAVAEPRLAQQSPAADERGLLGSVADRVAGVADRSTTLMSEVRDRTTHLVDSAIAFLGVRYKHGGSTAATGFDCSGFTRYIFENSIGRVLPHTAGEQANSPDLVKVDKKDLQPGDLVFFDTLRRTFSHVGIYLGDGKFIHSPRTGQSIRIEDINISYWSRHFTGARRAPELASAGGDAGAATAALAKLAAQADSAGASSAFAAAIPPVLPGPLADSAPPTLPDRVAIGFAPLHEPFTPLLADR